MVAILAVCALSATLCLLYVYGPTPINGADDYIYYNLARDLLLPGGFHIVAKAGVLAQQFILLYGIALFYYILGVSGFSSSIFGILSVALTSVALYKVGSVYYGRDAGILAAFFYSFSPLPAIYGPVVGDNTPMALIITLAVMLMVMGRRDEGTLKGATYTFLSGFCGVIGMLVTSQSIIILPLLCLMLLYYIARPAVRRKASASIIAALPFAAGMAAAACVVAAAGYLSGNGPLYIFTLNSGIYASNGSSAPQIQNYLEWLFPYGIVAKVTAGAADIVAAPSLQSLGQLLYGIITLDPSQPFLYEAGFFGYAGIISAAYLLARRQRHLALPALWLLTTLLYLSYGTVSLSSYISIGYAYPRFGLIYEPALAMLIGFGVAAFLRVRRNGLLGSAMRGFCYGLVIILFLNSLSLIKYVNTSQYVDVVPLRQIGAYIDTLPAGSVVYDNGIPIDAYVTRSIRVVRLPPQFYQSNCSAITPGTYIVIPQNISLQESCMLETVFSPHGNTTLMGYYGIFLNATFQQPYNLRLYYYSGLHIPQG